MRESPHHADGAHGQKHGESLPDLVIEPGAADFLQIDQVGLAQNFELVRSDLARAANGEAGAREGVATDELVGQAELAAENRAPRP